MSEEHDENRLKENLYATKSIMKSVGLGYQKIDICPNVWHVVL
jgi:hypothetical protein